jgi:hypothetical protein
MKTPNELHRTELTTQELKLLVEFYDGAIDELKDCKSPILKAQQADCFARREELERMFDGRWLNKGRGRKSKPPADPGPELPIPPSEPAIVEKP